jgi:hypothetical protein
MVNVLGENYFIDLDKIEEYLEFSTEITDFSGDTEQKVNLIKFELVKLLLETVLTEGDDGFDEKLGIKSATKTSIPFRLAFNSLLNKKLINHY